MGEAENLRRIAYFLPTMLMFDWFGAWHPPKDYFLCRQEVAKVQQPGYLQVEEIQKIFLSQVTTSDQIRRI